METSSNPQSNEAHLISVPTIYNIIGLTAMMLPLILLIANMTIAQCAHPEKSVSEYFHTRMSTLFVGALTTIAIFLFAYKGYEKEPMDLFSDNQISNLAGITLLGVVIFPTGFANCDGNRNCYLYDSYATQFEIFPTLHFIAAIITFILLAAMAFFMFTRDKPDFTKLTVVENPSIADRLRYMYQRSNPKGVTGDKRKKNRVFLICAWIIIITLLVTGGLFGLGCHNQSWFSDNIVLFWLETIMMMAFGFAWLSKGEMIFK